MRLTSRLLTAIVGLAPALAAAQSPFNPALLAPRTDSLTISANGRALGYAVETLRATDEGFELTNTTSTGRLTQRTRVTFTKSLEMLRVVQDGSAAGQKMSIDVTYANGRAKGRAVTPGQSGMKDIAVDTIVPRDAIDDNALQLLLPTLEMREGVTHALNVFASGQGELRAVTATVGAVTSVTVPAGTFDAYPVTVTGLAVPIVFHVSKNAPRRVVSAAPTGSPLHIELAR